MLRADGGDHGPLPADDLGVILWIHSDGQLEAPESLNTTTTHIINSHVHNYTHNKLALNIKTLNPQWVENNKRNGSSLILIRFFA